MAQSAASLAVVRKLEKEACDILLASDDGLVTVFLKGSDVMSAILKNSDQSLIQRELENLENERALCMRSEKNEEPSVRSLMFRTIECLNHTLRHMVDQKTQARSSENISTQTDKIPRHDEPIKFSQVIPKDERIKVYQKITEEDQISALHFMKDDKTYKVNDWDMSLYKVCEIKSEMEDAIDGSNSQISDESANEIKTSLNGVDNEVSDVCDSTLNDSLNDSAYLSQPIEDLELAVQSECIVNERRESVFDDLMENDGEEEKAIDQTRNTPKDSSLTGEGENKGRPSRRPLKYTHSLGYETPMKKSRKVSSGRKDKNLTRTQKSGWSHTGQSRSGSVKKERNATKTVDMTVLPQCASCKNGIFLLRCSCSD